ncbi:MAG: zonular occludens toxin domain-containing protein [Defluviitaleaceae bacterium]|nr:zonular occludens toxin domain-containing protein [Defluviitaleaceae bacterium]MCL2275811.1 zonular occludens toxin domain-containing protein [Defluviitaleaceae bacterium]
MITFYSGTPGSGKSFHMAKQIQDKLRFGRNIISTVNIDVNKVSKNGKKKIGDFVYVPIMELHPKFLYKYAIKNHQKGKEGQTVIIIDECQIIFNPRDYQSKGNNRAEWILFFTKHRHLGYNIIMTSQFDRLVDRQIRSLFEYEITHRKINNYGLLFLLPWTFFACIEYWYGNKMIISKRFLKFNKKTASIYDSYTMFDEFAELVAEMEDEEAEARAKAIEISTYDESNEEPIEEPTTQAVGAQMGAGGPHRSDRRWWQWFTKDIAEASLKS